MPKSFFAGYRNGISHVGWKESCHVGGPIEISTQGEQWATTVFSGATKWGIWSQTCS